MNKAWLLGTFLALLTAWPQLSSAAQTEEVTRSAYKVLDNRFRLDHGIEEVTLVIYRTPGAGPAVLIQPDGSKLYAHTTPSNVSWFGEGDFDVITIKKPMPGPWQIIGSLDRRNNIEILSDLQLRMDEAPRVIYQNERLKLTAELVNYGNKLNIDAFYVSTELALYLLKRQVTKNGEFAGSDTNKIGRFFDNGTGLDEYPRDGLFTGELDFVLPPGRYQLYMNVSNKTFNRGVSQDVELKKNPIQGKVIRVKDSAKKLHYSINPVELELESVAINLLVQGSGDFQHPLTIVAPEQAQVDIELDFLERSGDYKVSGWLFATTVSGREVAIAIPPERFSIINRSAPSVAAVNLAKMPSDSEVAVPKLSTGNRRLVTDPVAEPEPEEADRQAEEESSSLWIWILIIVVVLMIIAGGLGWFLIKRKKSAGSGQDSDDKGAEADIDLNRPEER